MPAFAYCLIPVDTWRSGGNRGGKNCFGGAWLGRGKAWQGLPKLWHEARLSGALLFLWACGLAPSRPARTCSAFRRRRNNEKPPAGLNRRGSSVDQHLRRGSLCSLVIAPAVSGPALAIAAAFAQDAGPFGVTGSANTSSRGEPPSHPARATMKRPAPLVERGGES